MKLFAIFYFLALGYCVRAFDWDKAAVRAAGNVIDQVAARWALAADEARREAGAPGSLASKAEAALGFPHGA